MTIIQLEYFLAVANYGSFSAAAENSFVTQPSLSMQIKNLEDELGVVLLDRSRKPVIPTEAGRIVLEQAKEAISSFYNIKEKVSDLKGEVAGTLRLGVIPTIAPYLLHKFIPAFSRKYPKVELEIREMITPDIIEDLEKDMLDAAIMAGGAPHDIQEIELFNDKFYAYVSPSNNLYERSNIRIEDIDVRQLLLLSEGHCLRDQVMELCQAKRKVASGYNFESGSIETLMRIVDNTSAITIIPEMVIDFIPEERRSQVKTLAKGAASRKITMAVRRTYVKRSLIKALQESVIAVAK